MERGYNVEIWRIEEGNSAHIRFSSGMYEGENYYEFNLDEYKERVEETYNNSVFVFFSLDNAIAVVAKKRAQYVLVEGVTACFCPEGEVAKKLSKSSRDIKAFSNQIGLGLISIKICIEIIKNKMIRKALYHSIRQSPPFAVVSSTRYAAEIYVPKMLMGIVEFIHALDYDVYIETNRENNNMEGSHIVYCDSGFFHKGKEGVLFARDMGEEYEQEYYKQLDILFRRLEDYYHLPVVIAGHPHTIYGNDAFGGRTIVHGKTCELTKNARLFLTTNSTAVNYAVLYDIPVIKIANKILRNVDCYGLDAYELIKYEAEYILECGFLDLDNEDEMRKPWEYSKKINNQKRVDFIKKYIIDNNTKDKTVIEYLEKIINKAYGEKQNEE